MIDRVAIGVESQVTVVAIDLRVEPAYRCGRGVAAGAHADHGTETIGATAVVVQHIAADGAALLYRIKIGFGRRYVIDDVHHDGAGDHVAEGISGLISEGFVSDVRAVVGVRRGARWRSQRVGVSAVRVEHDLPVLTGSATDQRIGDRAHSAADRTHQGAGRRFTGAARLAADHGASRQILAVLGQVEGFFVDRYVSVADCFQTAVTHIDGDGGGAFIAIGIAHGVGEHIHRTGTAHGVRVAVIDRVAVGIEGQVAVGAVDLAVQAADRRGRRVAAGTHADHRATRRWAIRAADVVVQHVAADSAALRH
ncbi:hypothetical protein D3C81_686630 [compost metagenome]